MTEADGIDVDLFETCFGIIVVTYRRAQQLRFIISYDSGTERFSVAPWTAWRRVPQEEDTDFDVAQVFVASGEDISDMETAWAQSTELSSAASTIDKLKKLAAHGPAALQEARAAAQRAADKQRKQQKAATTKAAKAAADEKAAADAKAAAAADAKAVAAAKAAADAKAAAAKANAAAADAKAVAAANAKAVADAKAAEDATAAALADLFSTPVTEGAGRPHGMTPQQTPPPPPPPPPPEKEWQQAFAADGKPYYFNVLTREAVWQLPSASSAPPLPRSSSSAAASDQFCSDQFCSSSPNPELRYGMSPTSFRHEIRGLKRQHYVLSQEMHEIVDPVCRQQQAREIALLEARLHERGVCL